MEICKALNKTKSKLHDQWTVENEMLKQKESIKKQKKAEMGKEVDTFIRCFNATYPEMKACRPWFSFTGGWYGCLKISIARKRGGRVAEVHFNYGTARYDLLTGKSCFFEFYESLEDLINSQSFIDCLKPNANPITLSLD